MGGFEVWNASSNGAVLEIPPMLRFNSPRNPGRGPCLVGSLTGAVSSQRVTEEYEGGAQRGRKSRVEYKVRV